MSAAPEQQGAAEHVLVFITDISVEDQMLELLAVAMEFLLLKLVLEKLRDDFGFGNWTNPLHAASSKSESSLR